MSSKKRKEMECADDELQDDLEPPSKKQKKEEDKSQVLNYMSNIYRHNVSIILLGTGKQ